MWLTTVDLLSDSTSVRKWRILPACGGVPHSILTAKMQIRGKMSKSDSGTLGGSVWEYLRTQLGEVLSGDSVVPTKRAISYLSMYLVGTVEDGEALITGDWPLIGRRFDHLGIPDEYPDEITAADLVAVSFLSVSIPPRGAWDILNRRSQAMTQVLQRIPRDMSIEDEACTLGLYGSDGVLQEMWNLLRRDPDGALWEMGPAKVSKLMARKRPALVPIQDSVVVSELGAADITYWGMWWQAMHLEVGGRRVVVDFVRALRDHVPEAADLSLLRVLDIVIWMHGRYGQADQ